MKLKSIIYYSQVAILALIVGTASAIGTNLAKKNIQVKPVVSNSVISLTESNTVIFDSKIDNLEVYKILSELRYRRAKLSHNKPLYLVIVSGGGYYDAAKFWRKELATIPNLTLICKYCASAAGYIFATFEGPRLVIDKSLMVMHEMYIDHVTANMLMRLDLFEGLSRNSQEFNKAISDIIGISPDEYSLRILDRNWEVEGSDIVNLHLADKVIKLNCSPKIADFAPNTCSE
jgi:hypothetical protein